MILKLLASENFITYSKIVAKKLGVNVAILLGALCSYQTAFDNEPFYKSQEKISDDTCLSIYEIQQATKILKENELITVERKGLPAKNYYFIDEIKLSNFLITSSQKIKQQEVEKLDDINNNINNNNINNKKEEDKEEKTTFDCKSYDEFIKTYNIQEDNFSSRIGEMDFKNLMLRYKESKWLRTNITTLSQVDRFYRKIISGSFKDFEKPNGNPFLELLKEQGETL